MRTVFWQDNQVNMIDQRLLPGEFEIATFATVGEVARSNQLFQEGLGLLDQRLPALPLPAEKIA